MKNYAKIRINWNLMGQNKHCDDVTDLCSPMRTVCWCNDSLCHHYSLDTWVDDMSNLMGYVSTDVKACAQKLRSYFFELLVQFLSWHYRKKSWKVLSKIPEWFFEKRIHPSRLILSKIFIAILSFPGTRPWQN